jgi:hypothetical protein
MIPNSTAAWQIKRFYVIHSSLTLACARRTKTKPRMRAHLVQTDHDGANERVLAPGVRVNVKVSGLVNLEVFQLALEKPRNHSFRNVDVLLQMPGFSFPKIWKLKKKTNSRQNRS